MPDCQCVLCSPSANQNFDRQEQKAIGDINEHGWHAIKVGSPDGLLPWWCYSLGVPDLIMASLDPDGMHYWITETVEVIRNGRRFHDGDSLQDVLEGYTLVLREVAPGWQESLVGWAGWFSQTDTTPFQQLVWPDPNHRMPWDQDASENCQSQPQLWIPPSMHPQGPWTEWHAEANQ